MKTHLDHAISFGSLLGLTILAGGCGSSSSTSGASMSTRFAVNGITSVAASASQDRPDGEENLNSTLNLMQLFSDPEQSIGLLAAGDFAQSGVGSTAISSLQFYITRIQLCTGLTITGSGYSDMQNCIDAFGSANSDNAYDTYKVADAIADTTSTSWVDLMSTSSISSFTTNSERTSQAGTYNYVVIETHKPIKLNAQFSAPNVSGMRTCTRGTVSSTGSGTSLSEKTTQSDITSCTRGLATFGGQGGGKWFKLQNPVTIVAGNSYILDLAYNADNALTGGLISAMNSNSATYTDGTRGIYFPTLDVSPVLRQSTQKTIREEYEIAMNDLNGTLLLDLYYVGERTNVGTGTIVGAQARFINGASASSVVNWGSPYSITSSGGTISINDWQSQAIVSGLTRSTTQTAGGTQSVSVNRSSGSSGSGTGTYTATFKGVLQM